MLMVAIEDKSSANFGSRRPLPLLRFEWFRVLDAKVCLTTSAYAGRSQALSHRIRDLVWKARFAMKQATAV